ncbi:hypothetical protein [Algoriphagus chordae]|uniref:Uncharacterized protein n=1 Tax=Algoriphagus chordae TaxID=237019 RepID=A0A2W7RAY0_9BACT|nr:hypothetical protein [Algoriphagus chordae]PZX47795.1 hypothetical protein LV85_03779 [Algoriphagus chordae]
MDYKKSKLYPVKIVGILVFFLAFVLNIQTDVNGDWGLVSNTNAKEVLEDPPCVSQPVGDDAYMLCGYKKVFLSTNCIVKANKTCLLRDTGPGWPEIPSLP